MSVQISTVKVLNNQQPVPIKALHRIYIYQPQHLGFISPHLYHLPHSWSCLRGFSSRNGKLFRAIGREKTSRPMASHRFMYAKHSIKTKDNQTSELLCEFSLQWSKLFHKFCCTKRRRKSAALFGPDLKARTPWAQQNHKEKFAQGVIQSVTKKKKK